MIDIGANLGHESFQPDLDQVLDTAQSTGIEHIVVTGTSVAGSRDALALARQYPAYLSATAGIHPHEAADCTAEAIADLRTLARDPLVRALGETGLDFHRDYSPRAAQESAFDAQLDLACELGMPLFLHQRDAHERFLQILEPRLAQLGPVVVHCFTGTEAELRDYIAHDLYIGITGWICDERRGHHLHDLIALIPPERLMIETDSPYLLPRSIRPKPKSRRNEPANLGHVLATIAQCVGLPAGQVQQQTSRNARRFFGLNPS